MALLSLPLMLLWREVIWPLTASPLSREGGEVAGRGWGRPLARDVLASTIGELYEDAYDDCRCELLSFRLDIHFITTLRGRSPSGECPGGYSPIGVET